ncbi:MAG TPA: ferritin-like domain-containing protein [Solirubrobacteraceae bacterium]|nr:ferritin-like domain-containing protein [Solirubrobacteraceae bacterium]
MAGTATTRRELLRPGAADTARLQRLMSVEQLMLYVYDHVLSSSILPPATRRTMAQIQGHEQAHIGALRDRLRARGARQPPPPPSVAVANHYLAGRHVRGRLGQLQGPQDALYLLRALERVVVGAYFVALREMRDPGLIVLAAQIMASDAQHEAIVSERLNPGDIASAVPYGLVQGVQ